MRIVPRLAIALLVLGLALVPRPVRAAPYYVYLRFDLSGTGSGMVRTLTGPMASRMARSIAGS